MTCVVIVESGGGNVASIRFALDRLGASSVHSSDPDRIQCADRVILPGVGAAGDAMPRLAAAGLDRLIPKLRQPVLGICLGMQLLHEASEEGSIACLGIFSGTATHLQATPGTPVPHMGWNRIFLRAANPLLANIENGSYAYFAHSYAVSIGADTAATCEHGRSFSAVVHRNNFYGTNFTRSDRRHLAHGCWKTLWLCQANPWN